MANVGGRAKEQVTYFLVRNSLTQALRWGRVSAGFAGGRALGQAIRGVDDGTTAMMGSIFGGVFAATSLKAIPQSVATFAAFGYFIESFSSKNRAGSPDSKSSDRRLADELARRESLRKRLAESESRIQALQAEAA